MGRNTRYDHLPRRVSHSYHATGPFPFLNPTTRYIRVPIREVNKRQIRHKGGPAQVTARHAHRAPNALNVAATSADAITIANAASQIGSSRPPSDGTAEQEPQQPQSEPQQPEEPNESPHTRQEKALPRHIAGAYQVWRSRDNRKGRHAIVLTSDFFHRHHHLHGEPSPERPAEEPGVPLPRTATSVLRSSDSWRGVAHVLWKMATRYPVWDVSYDVAVIFTIGSAIWVVNSFFVWLPLAAPWTEFAHEETTAGGVSAVVGAAVFEVGALLGVLEAVNENRADCFGWALEEALESGMLTLRPNADDCKHTHVERARLFRKRRVRRRDAHNSLRGAQDGGGAAAALEKERAGCESLPQAESDGNLSSGSGSDSDGSPRPDTSRIDPQLRRWIWWPSWYELRTVYAHEMGFWACLIQFFGATVFWISGFTGLPPVADRLSTAATNGAFWAPQVIGGMGFVISSAMFMLETQRKWYLPAPQLLGWHVGLWNLVGSIGFTLCGALGFGAASSSSMQYASCLSTFVGSWAFLIGSIIQWYESLDKHPIQIQESLPKHVQQATIKS